MQEHRAPLSRLRKWLQRAGSQYASTNSAECVAIKCTNMFLKHRLLLLSMLLTLLFNNKSLSSLYRIVLVICSVLFLSLLGGQNEHLTFKGLLQSPLLDVTLLLKNSFILGRCALNYGYVQYETI